MTSWHAVMPKSKIHIATNGAEFESSSDQNERNPIISNVPPEYTTFSSSILLGSSFP
ncbi:29909_t:CDS:2 [Gigaspora margarita]|uniref:29909_t:CDS:1 n=1 Tax=Gigaspora margarita TaxID=4874 RepID=A0ABN7UGS9_GIGMA|nr:29909_t:CDS:2 [Gigaspora margarita]